MPYLRRARFRAMAVIACAFLLRAGFSAESRAGDALEKLKPFFAAPAAFQGDMGKYKSPLVDEHGGRITTAQQWQERRRQILARWHDLMGPWPAVISKPSIEVTRESKRENFTEQHVRVEIAAGEKLDGILLIPDGKGPFPAVLVPYYEPKTSVGGGQPLRDFGYQLTKRGFVSLSIGSPGGDARKPPAQGQAWQPLSYLAYVAANCAEALASHLQVDAKRIGVVGHSYGGKWAMFAGALHERFACVAVSDPGIVFDESRPNVNYWEPWYLGLDAEMTRKPGVPTKENPRTGAYKKMMEAGVDLHEIHALIAPRPFLVSGGSEDPPEQWRALNHLVAINRVLGFTNRVAMTNRPDHTPTEESNELLYAFFEAFLKP